MSELMTPIPFRELMTWITTEYRRDGAVFGVHKPYKAGVKKLPIFGEAIESRADAVAALGRLHERGAQNVLLTLGGDGAYFSNGEHVWHANAAEKDSILSTACAGDATLASFLSLWLADRGAVEPALTRAMATGANVTMCAGLGDFARVDELAKTVHVRQVA